MVAVHGIREHAVPIPTASFSLRELLFAPMPYDEPEGPGQVRQVVGMHAEMNRLVLADRKFVDKRLELELNNGKVRYLVRGKFSYVVIIIDTRRQRIKRHDLCTRRIGGGLHDHIAPYQVLRQGIQRDAFLIVFDRSPCRRFVKSPVKRQIVVFLRPLARENDLVAAGRHLVAVFAEMRPGRAEVLNDRHRAASGAEEPCRRAQHGEEKIADQCLFPAHFVPLRGSGRYHHRTTIIRVRVRPPRKAP